MRLLILAFFTMIFDTYADFSTERIKNWFKDAYDKGAAKVEDGVDSLKSSKAGTKIQDFWSETKKTYQENRVVTISSALQQAHQDFVDRAAKLNKELAADIQSLSQLEDIQYHDRVIIYQEGKQYVTLLEQCLAKEMRSIADAKAMKKEASDHMDNILNILNDELIYSYIDELREAYHEFNKAVDKEEKELRKKEKDNS